MATYPPQQGYPSQQGYPHQQSSTVVVHQQPATTHTLVVQERRGTNHLLHCLITLLFCPWIFVWIFFCITDP